MALKNNFANTTLKVDIPFTRLLLAMVIWALLSSITLGLALLFFPYYYNKMMLNHTYIINKQSKRISKLENNLPFLKIMPHAALWFVIIILTLGLGIFFFLFYAGRLVATHTGIKPL